MWRWVGRGRREQRPIVAPHPPNGGEEKVGLGRGEEVKQEVKVAFLHPSQGGDEGRKEEEGANGRGRGKDG